MALSQMRRVSVGPNAPSDEYTQNPAFGPTSWAISLTVISVMSRFHSVVPRWMGSGRLYTHSTMTPCPNCGFQNTERVKFCGECGQNLVAASSTLRPRRLSVKRLKRPPMVRTLPLA